MFRLIVGLGNPGREYEHTRHNAGFMAVERLAARHNAAWRTEKDWKSTVASAEGVVYCKPLGFMNLCGGPVDSVAHFYKVAPPEILVIYDDVALPLGKLRLRPGGSAGGHNGMASIIERLGTTEIPRLRLGIGAATGELTGHVLGRFTEAERPELEAALDRAVSAVEFMQVHDLPAAMNRFNG